MLRTVPIPIFALALAAALPAIAPAVPAEDGDVLYQGKWTKKSQKIAGTWKIIVDGEKRYVVLDEKFKTRKAPDLKLFLSPTPLDKVENKNAVKGSLKIALLKSHKGAQRYEIPAGADISRYQSLLIHCEKYTKLWGAAKLTPTKS